MKTKIKGIISLKIKSKVLKRLDKGKLLKKHCCCDTQRDT